MPAHRTARERARAELTEEIKDEARRQLADRGAAALSLRAVARELGMVSSALYRYFPSRDELLTALLVDAYTALGDALESAASDGQPADRWRAAAHAQRAWAREHRHEYSLLYGTPVPGYRAPDDTVGPAGRIPGAFLRIAYDAWHAGAVAPANGEPANEEPANGALHRQAQTVVDVLDLPGLPEPVLLRTVDAWTQLFGAIALELVGQFARTFDPADDYFAHAVERQVRLVGLT